MNAINKVLMKTQIEIYEKTIRECAEANGLPIIHLFFTERLFRVDVEYAELILNVSLIEHDFIFHLFKKISEAK